MDAIPLPGLRCNEGCDRDAAPGRRTRPGKDDWDKPVRIACRDVADIAIRL